MDQVTDLSGELSVDAIRHEFPNISDQLALMMLMDRSLIPLARQAPGYGSRPILSRQLDRWFEFKDNEGYRQLHAKCPEIQHLSLMSNRLGALVRSYRPYRDNGEITYFNVPLEDFLSTHSTVMVLAPFPDC